MDYFTLFDLPKIFTLDLVALQLKYYSLMRQTHPDQFVQGAPAQKQQATEMSAQINRAYQSLKDPVKRALYLFDLRGIALEGEHAEPMPMDFLSQQMDWHESLEDASPEDCAVLADKVTVDLQDVLREIAEFLDNKNNHNVMQSARKMLFYTRFQKEIMQKMEGN